jgi:hypothetical protein
VFAWEKILRRKEELAIQLDADWFIHHDADEFRESPWKGETLQETFGRIDAAGYNAIDFEVFDFRPTTADPTRAKSIRTRMQYYEPARSFDRLQIKCWKKTDQPVVLTRSGGHNAEFEGRRIFPVRFLLRHYSIRGQAHGERKVFKERLAVYDPSERANGWHVQYDDLTEDASFCAGSGIAPAVRPRRCSSRAIPSPSRGGTAGAGRGRAGAASRRRKAGY